MIKAELTGLQAVVDQMHGVFSARRVTSAAVTAITRTALLVKKAEQAEMRDVFDRPTPFTLGAVFVQPAKLERPYAVVGIANDSAGYRPPSAWLRWQVRGGLRRETAFEKLLVREGAMRSGDRMVPGKAARMDQFGNISRGQLVQILSQLRIESSSGSTRSLPRYAFGDTKRERNRKAGVIRRAYRRAGGMFVAFPNGRGKLLPGIYQIRQTGFGNADPRPVLIFVSKAQYEPRFDFDYVARRTVGLELRGQFAIALRQSAERKAGGA